MFFRKKKEENQRHYFDYAASTPIHSGVFQVVTEHMRESLGNPGALHVEGLRVKHILEDSRQKVAHAISAHGDEIIFTSGGTESDVLAIRGVVSRVRTDESFEGKPHVIVSAIEHSAVRDTVLELEKAGEIELSFLPVNTHGQVLLAELKKLVKKNTVLVSVLYVNNEIGVVQDIPALTKEVRRLKKVLHGERSSVLPLVHTDASQAMLLQSVSVRSLGVDLLSANSGKIYGPQGVGMLFVRRGIKLAPLFYAGGQERGIRPGTEPVALIAGLAHACELAVENREKEFERLSELKQYFTDKLKVMQSDSELKALGFELKINSPLEISSPHILHISIKDLESDQLVIELDARGIAVSAKSACKTLDPQTSHVLAAIGYGDNSWGSVRFSFGSSTAKDSIDTALRALEGVIRKLLHTKREFSL